MAVGDSPATAPSDPVATAQDAALKRFRQSDEFKKFEKAIKGAEARRDASQSDDDRAAAWNDLFAIRRQLADAENRIRYTDPAVVTAILAKDQAIRKEDQRRREVEKAAMQLPQPLPTTAPAELDIPPIDDYSFTWRLAKNGESELRIDKTRKSVTVVLKSEFHSVAMSAKDAEELGAVLAQAGEYWKKSKAGGDDAQPTIRAGIYKVTFRQDEHFGFSAFINTADGSPFGALRLGREDAIDFASYLQKAQKLVDRVNQKINP